MSKKLKKSSIIMILFSCLCFMFLLASTNVNAQTTTKIEQDCYNSIQGKVAWNTNGNKSWGDNYVKELCQGTTNTAATIACFQAEIQKHNDWRRGIDACKASTTTQNTTTTTSASIEQQCYDAIQGKVAWNRNGNKSWGEAEVKELCRGTTDTAATIACFQEEIQKHNEWRRGIDACKVGATTPRATATKSASTTTPNQPPPLTESEMAEVMKWISIKTSAARLPFCWRKSEGRGFGEIPLCPSGYVKEGLLCAQPCKADERGIDAYCYKNCPAGFRDDGLYCGKPAAYTRESFPWKIGDPLLPNYSGPTGRCEAKYGKGNCERGGALIFPKCNTGFYAVAEGSVCSPVCPSGYSDIGVSCKKPTTTRNFTYANTCPTGLEKDKTGDICYPTCEQVTGSKDYTGVGPICWQNCPSQQSVDCGAGCATTGLECAKSVFTMTSAPIIAAVKIAALIVTFGGSSAATTSAGAGVGGGKLLANSPKLAKLAQLADKLRRFYKTNEDLIKIGSANKTMILTWKSQIDIFATEFANNFGDMTSPEVEEMIDRKFSKEAAFEIKKEWGRHHVGLMMEANGINTAKNVLSVAGIADPTGITGVVSAFTHPLCKDDTPFPTVNPKY